MDISLNFNFNRYEKKVWIFKLLIMPSIIALVYSVAWNITGNIRIVALFIAVMVFLVAVIMAVDILFGLIIAFIIWIMTIVIAIDMVAFMVAFVITSTTTIVIAKNRYYTPIKSNIISAAIQFLITWGLLYIAQHVHYTFTFSWR